MCGKGGAGVDGVVYGVGDVEVVFGKIGGTEGDVSDVEGVKVVGFEDGVSVVGVKVVGLGDGAIVVGGSEEVAPEEVASSEGASLVVERGQGRPAVEASRLFSMVSDMIPGINMGKTNGCSNAERSVAEHVSRHSRHNGWQKLKNKWQKVNGRMLGND